MKDVEMIDAAVERRRRRHNSRIKQRYWLAKELGFTPAEATVLQHKTEDFIRKIHAQKVKIFTEIEVQK